YVDVTIDSAFSPSGTGTSATTVETGTVSYAAWLVENGSQVYGVSDVVPLNSSIVGTWGFSYVGLPYGGGAVPGYDLSAFGLDAHAWDHENWQDSLTFNAAGTYLENNDGTYQFTNRYSSDSWWKRDRTWAPGTGTGAGTEVLKKEYGGSYTSDITTGNGAGNFPTGTVQYEANGYPTTVLAAPAQGTTVFARWFSSQNYRGNSTTTNGCALVG